MDATKSQCREELKKLGWLKGLILDNDETADLILDYIQTHKYLVNETLPFTISFDMAMHSWYENVYQPILHAIHSTHLRDIYPKDVSLFLVFKDVSNVYWEHNNQVRPYDGKLLITYEDACRIKLFSLKGFWLAKFRALILG